LANGWDTHNVTCHLTQVNTPRLNPGQTGLYSIFLSRRDVRLSWPRGGLWSHSTYSRYTNSIIIIIIIIIMVFPSTDGHPSKY